MLEAENFKVKPSNTQEKIPFENIEEWSGKSFLERLNLQPDATPEEIKKAFRRLSLKYHPDKVSNDEELRKNYGKVQQLLGEAYNELSGRTKKSIGGDDAPFQWRRNTNEFNQFNEVEVVKLLVEEISNDLIIYSCESVAKKVRGEMDELIHYGVSNETILKSVEKLFLEKFPVEVSQHIKHAGFTELHQSIKNSLGAMVGIGIKRDELLMKIHNVVIDGFVYENSKPYLLPVDSLIDSSNDMISEVSEFGIPREKFTNAIEKILIEKFKNETIKYLERYQASTTASIIQEKLTRMLSFGINETNALQSISDLKDKSGKYIKNFLKKADSIKNIDIIKRVE